MTQVELDQFRAVAIEMSSFLSPGNTSTQIMLRNMFMEFFDRTLEKFISELDNKEEEENESEKSFEEYFEDLESDFGDRFTKEFLKHSRWSYKPVNPKAIPFPKAKTLVYEDVSIVLPSQPTWKNLAQAADQAIAQMGHVDHIFIEKFINRGTIIELSTGS